MEAERAGADPKGFVPALVFVALAALAEGVESSLAAPVLRIAPALFLFRSLAPGSPFPVPRRALPVLLLAAAATALSWSSAAWAPGRWVAIQWSLNLSAAFFAFLAGCAAFRRGSLPAVSLPVLLLCASAVELPVQAVQLLAGADRPAGTFFNPNWLAALHAASVLCLLALLLRPPTEGEGRRRAAAAAGALLLLAATAATGSRGALVALGAGSAALLAFGGGRRRPLLLAATAAILVAAALLSPAGKRFLGGGDPYAWSRLRIWSAAASVAREHPLGAGAGNFRFLFPRHALPEPGGVGRFTKSAGNAHGEFFQALADLGWPGALLFAAVGATLLAAALRRLRDTSSAWPVRGAAAVTVSLGTHSLLDAAFHPLALALPASLAAALVLGGAGEETEGDLRPSAGWILAGRGAVVVVTVLSLSAFAGRVAERFAMAAARRGGDSVSSFRAAALLDPLCPDHAYNLSGALFAAARKGGDPSLLDRSLRAMDRAVAMNPADLRYRLRRIQILEAAGAAPAEAGRIRREYDEAVALQPRNALLLAAAARQRSASGDGAGARALLERAVAAEPAFAGGREELARLLRAGDPARAAALEAEAAAIRGRYGSPARLSPAERRLLTFRPGDGAEPEERDTERGSEGP